MTDDRITHPRRPLPPRPATGLLAWQATLGYISSHYSPDATLRLFTTSHNAQILWSAEVVWGGNSESVKEYPSLAGALRELWREVSTHHALFEDLEAATKAPSNYDDSDWLDLPTQETLQRLVWVTRIAFPGDWLLMAVYQPLEAPEARVQMRLLAKENTVLVGGRGASLLDAIRVLFRNAAPYYAAQSGKKESDLPEL
ncbi:MAG: hypothetical protein H7Y11_03415 [Armatimonadetes bacterium]|nr:hypothetical protein [Anaerolineae bacterium]